MNGELSAFADEYGIAKTFGSLDDSLEDIARDFREWLKKEHGNMGLQDHILSRDGALFLKNSAKVLGDWVDDHFDQSERFTIQRRKNDILKALCVEGAGRKVHRIDGRPCKCVRFS